MKLNISRGIGYSFSLLIGLQLTVSARAQQSTDVLSHKEMSEKIQSLLDQVGVLKRRLDQQATLQEQMKSGASPSRATTPGLSDLGIGGARRLEHRHGQHEVLPVLGPAPAPSR
jgi:hypothetical protein